MKRLLCVFTFAASVLLPDWAAACWLRGARPVYYYEAPVYCAPISTLPAGPLYVSGVPVAGYPCLPGYASPVLPAAAGPAPLQPPRIVPASAGRPSAPVSRPPQVEPVRPVVSTEPLPPPIPQPKPDEAKIPPVSVPKTPLAGVQEPTLDLPKADTSPQLPPLVLPDDEEPKKPHNPAPTPSQQPPLVPPSPQEPKKPHDPATAAPPEPRKSPHDLPPVSPPALPADNPGVAVPVPAPSPDILTPPEKPGQTPPDGLPPLTLPPDSPVVPLVPPKEVQARSSPLSGAAQGVRVSVFPANGNRNIPGLRQIGFYNHTRHDLTLTIEGQTVKLPAMTYLHAQLPPQFRWKCGHGVTTTETVPADATGVDIVIRE
ncbi:MAG: hypothetical protein RMJ56_12600 [Gemmataceae bacterium]|nr:hypothetical protein [Gemmata sp.]MDW8198433.1 hypothetical protein [Gemmataceae bacterium]